MQGRDQQGSGNLASEDLDAYRAHIEVQRLHIATQGEQIAALQAQGVAQQARLEQLEHVVSLLSGQGAHVGRLQRNQVVSGPNGGSNLTRR